MTRMQWLQLGFQLQLYSLEKVYMSKETRYSSCTGSTSCCRAAKSPLIYEHEQSMSWNCVVHLYKYTV